MGTRGSNVGASKIIQNSCDLVRLEALVPI